MRLRWNSAYGFVDRLNAERTAVGRLAAGAAGDGKKI